MPKAATEKFTLFEETPIPRAVATLSLPTVASCLVAVLYSLADTYFVGLLNNPVQTAAVTLAAPVLLAFNAVNNLFGVGSSSMMSRAMGRRDGETLRRSSAFGFYGSMISGILYSLLCLAFLTPLLRLLGADAITADPTRRYLFWTVIIGAAPSILSVVIAYMIRSEGATLHAGIGSMSGCFLNILLDPIFILPWGLNMGAEGAALATCISNVFAMGYFFVYLFVRRHRTVVCIHPSAFCLRKDIVGGVCAVGVPAAIQNLLNVISHMLLNNLASPFGSSALAAMGIAYKIGMVPMYIANGISQGVMPLIGYTYAAKLTVRMKKALSFTAKVSEGLLCVIAVLCCLFSASLVASFMDDAQTVAYGSVFLWGFALSIPFLAMDFLAVGVFQAVGKGSLSLIMAIARKVVFEIPALFTLNAIIPPYGLAFAQLVAEVFMTAIGTVLLLRLLRRCDREAGLQRRAD